MGLSPSSGLLSGLLSHHAWLNPDGVEVKKKKKFMQTGCEMLRQASVIVNAAVYCVPGGPLSQQPGLTRRMNSTPVSFRVLSKR